MLPSESKQEVRGTARYEVAVCITDIRIFAPLS
jgi:hypothetical protein